MTVFACSPMSSFATKGKQRASRQHALPPGGPSPSARRGKDRRRDKVQKQKSEHRCCDTHYQGAITCSSASPKYTITIGVIRHKKSEHRCCDTHYQGGDYLLFRFRSTIGVIRFNFSVRNGKRWSPYALIALVSLSCAHAGVGVKRVTAGSGGNKSHTHSLRVQRTSLYST